MYCKGFDTDPRSTDHLTDPLTEPPAELTPYKINGKMKIKKAQNYHDETRFNKFSLPETSKMAVALQISNSFLI